MPSVLRNVNPTRAITWLVGLSIYCTIFNDNPSTPLQFFRGKIVLEKKAGGNAHYTTVNIEFELRGPGPPLSYICFQNCLFLDKTKISEENRRVNDYCIYC